MTFTPWCTVVIPTYNYARFVGRAMDSALESAGPAREVVVVDDGSTDDTQQVLQRYEGRVRVLAQSNQGVSAARNRGIAVARGRYVICLDADDRLLSDGLRILAELAERTPDAGMVFGAYQTIDDVGQVRPAYPPPPMTVPVENFCRFLRHEFAIGNGRAAIRRDVFDRVQFPVEITHGEDMVVFGQILALYDAVSTSELVAESFEHPARARHNLAKFLEGGIAPIDALFRADLLPPEALALRSVFASRWYTELARTAFKLGDRRSARQFYHQAFAANWTGPLRGRHLGRYLRCYLPQRRAA